MSDEKNAREPILQNNSGLVNEEKIRRAASEINFKDPSLTLNYGAKSMDAIAKFADTI